MADKKINHQIRVSVKGFFFDSTGRILLAKGLHREKNPSGEEYFVAPGGGVDGDEDLISALKREAVEETGFTVEVGNIVYVQDYTNFFQKRQLEIFFRGTVDENQIPKSDPDHEWQFFSKEEFKKITFLPSNFDPFGITDSIEFHSPKSKAEEIK